MPENYISNHSVSKKNQLFFGLFAKLLVILLLLQYPDSSAAAEPPLLWEKPTKSPAADKIGNSKWVKIKPNLTLLRPGNSQNKLLTLELPGLSVSAVKKRSLRRNNNNYTWFGHIAGKPQQAVILTVVNDILFGSIRLENQTFQVTLAKNGEYHLEAITGIRTQPDDSVPVTVSNIPEQKTLIPQKSLVAPQAAPVIDVLMLYTDEMQTKHGAGLPAYLQSLLDITNSAFTDSGVIGQLNLLPVQQITPAMETDLAENNSISDALTNIKNRTDIATLRNDTGADLVALIRSYHGAGSCGRAGYGYSIAPGGEKTLLSKYGFSVVDTGRWDIGNGSYYYCTDHTFAHETGHNLGGNHDRDHASSSGLYSYSYGYDVADEFATIMSYDEPDILYFSTPDVMYNSLPIGQPAGHSEEADNVSTFNLTIPTVAAFHESVVSSPENSCSGDNPIVSNTVYSANDPILCAADQSIATGPAVTINPNATVTFSAPLIRLLPGFQAQGQFNAGNFSLAADLENLTSINEPDFEKKTPTRQYDFVAEIPPAAIHLTSSQLPDSLTAILQDRKVEIGKLRNIMSDREQNVVVFTSDQALLEYDTNGFSDIYLFETETEHLQLISRNQNGNAANGNSDYAAMDGFAQHIVFQSEADDLSEQDDDGNSDIFLYNAVDQSISLISANSPYPALHPAVQADGLSVLYDQADRSHSRQIYRYDIIRATEENISIMENADAEHPDHHHPALSPNGKQYLYIAESPDHTCHIHFYDEETDHQTVQSCSKELWLHREIARPVFNQESSTIHWIIDDDKQLLTKIP